jgi:hypothetical protein
MNIPILSILLLALTSCRSNHVSTLQIDPWHGRYMHSSGKFNLILDHFMKESVSVDILEQGLKRPHSSFFAEFKGADEAMFQDRREPDCRVLLKNTNEGIVVRDQCGGTGEADGLYKRIGDLKQ